MQSWCLIVGVVSVGPTAEQDFEYRMELAVERLASVRSSHTCVPQCIGDSSIAALVEPRRVMFARNVTCNHSVEEALVRLMVMMPLLCPL